MQDRVLPFEGIHNFRDYGGYKGRDGAMLRTGLLFRSAQHRDATQEDLDAVDLLRLNSVIDLRGESERSLNPCPRHRNFSAKVHHADGETAAMAVHEEAAFQVQTVDDARKRMNFIYSGMGFRPQLVQVFQMYFDALANHPGASLIHCLAGKDRTGVGVALVHDLLGVHPDDIMADYMLTNTAGDNEARIAAGLASWSSGREMSIDAARVLMSVEADYLNTAFASIRERHGSTRDYLRNVLSVTPEMEAKICANFLE